MNVLLLHSSDGQDWCHPVLYPKTWTEEMALERARNAIKEVQEKDPEEYDWDMEEVALTAAGFTITNWVHSYFFWDTRI